MAVVYSDADFVFGRTFFRKRPYVVEKRSGIVHYPQAVFIERLATTFNLIDETRLSAQEREFILGYATRQFCNAVTRASAVSNYMFLNDDPSILINAAIVALRAEAPVW